MLFQCWKMLNVLIYIHIYWKWYWSLKWTDWVIFKRNKKKINKRPNNWLTRKWAKIKIDKIKESEIKFFRIIEIFIREWCYLELLEKRPFMYLKRTHVNWRIVENELQKKLKLKKKLKQNIFLKVKCVYGRVRNSDWLSMFEATSCSLRGERERPNCRINWIFGLFFWFFFQFDCSVWNEFFGFWTINSLAGNYQWAVEKLSAKCGEGWGLVLGLHAFKIEN